MQSEDLKLKLHSACVAGEIEGVRSVIDEYPYVINQKLDKVRILKEEQHHLGSYSYHIPTARTDSNHHGC